MSVGYFETPLGPNNPHLYGSIEGVVIQESGDGAVDPTQVISIGSDWSVRLYWEFKGKLTKMICGSWCIHLYLESMGPGPELKLPVNGEQVPLDPCGNGEYHHTIKVPAGTVTTDHCSTPYKLVVGLTYLTTCDDRPGPIAGFVEGPIVQFFDPH
jgi:hypothetical protein